MSQITYIPKNKFNTDPGSSTTWYSKSGKPLKIWRKTGYTNSLGTNISSKSYNCGECTSDYIIGKEFKMLGKYLTTSKTRDGSGCLNVDETRGPVGTTGSGARIRSAVTKVNKTYHTHTKAYLESRNKNYSNNQFISKLPNVTYYDSNKDYVWPTDQSVNSSMYQGRLCDNGKYKTVIYKPSNPQFGVQGAVDSSSRIHRLKHNTMEKSSYLVKNKSTPCLTRPRGEYRTRC